MSTVGWFCSVDREFRHVRQQYASLQRLASLPDEVAAWPTHGAGSFCPATPRAKRTTTTDMEKVTNPLRRTGDEGAFVTALFGSLGIFPPSLLRLAADTLSIEPTVEIRGHGERAMSAAYLLEHTGHHGIAVLEGDADACATATDRSLEDWS